MIPKKSIEREICEYLDGDLDQEMQARLESRLSQDPEALDLLCTHALMGASLRQPLALVEPAAHHLLRKQKRKSLQISLAVAAAIALLAAVVLNQIIVPRTETWATVDTAPGTLMSIRSSGPGDLDGKLDVGETLVVSQGTAQITLADGTRCVAEAPARITLLNNSRAHLSHGRAFFNVAKGSEGFVVTTKDLKVVDLGTAFGIDDRAERQPEVHVKVGKVLATALLGRRESCEVVAGESVAVGVAGTLRPIASNTNSFFERLPEGLPSIRFGFDREADGRMVVSGTIARQENVHLLRSGHSSSGPTVSVGRLGEGLLFKDRRDRLESTWAGIGGSVPRTISLWVRIPKGSQGGSILGWGLPSGSRQMSDLKVTYSGDNLANLRLSSGRRWLQTTQRLDTGRWHHVAFLVDSPEADRWPTVKCYVDGVLEPVTPRVPEEGEVAPLMSFETITDHPNSRPLTFGNLSTTETGNAFTGEIDEVAIAAGLLTEKEIQALHHP